MIRQSVCMAMVVALTACSGQTSPPATADASVSPGTAAVVIATGFIPPLSMVSDGTTLFIVQERTGQLSGLPVHGGQRVSLLDSGVSPRFLAIDSTQVYVVVSQGLYAVPKAGGAP